MRPQPSLASVFVEQVVRCGLTVAGLVDDLAQATPPDAYPGEDPTDVVLEMITGSFGMAAESVERETLVSAIELVTAVVDSALADLDMVIRLREAGEAA